MKILIRQARIIDSSSPFHQQKADIFIHNGIISSIGNDLQEDVDKIIDIPGLHVSPGWIDVFANFCDPGFEYKETLETGSLAAAAGGFTDVFVIPATSPVIHNKAAVEYIVQKSKILPATIHPIGAVSKNLEGKELAEMYDMYRSGAVAFGDGITPIQSAGILLKALQYLKAIDGVLIQLPDDKSISNHGLMHEGIVSTQLGLPGKPAIAEELLISRDIELVKYTGSKIHFTGVSTAKSIALIQQAKAEGINVTCSVTPHHLCFCDEDLVNYDTNLKVNPPLRTKEDREALREAVLSGVIDCIATHHLPHEKDSKIVEFEYAKNGIIGLESAFGVVKNCLPSISTERLVELFSTQPRKIFNLPVPRINEKEEACLSLFLEDQKWVLNNKDIRSRSENSPFIGKELTGKPLGIITKDRLFLNS
ncbi:dihydroorotase [Chitinophagaceae bacterium LB-8]|uniref:Dihydroorotase n=1 Tax=Paraflavisolibacter caeni TaxID=2982496 RepID=A0A9X2XV21_9BACT|nr:dihydroorotase [Paraflavisolibacter caeni]MCU7549057.1 dihydroorotase [Paraflavisolibacter caeni]